MYIYIYIYMYTYNTTGASAPSCDGDDTSNAEGGCGGCSERQRPALPEPECSLRLGKLSLVSLRGWWVQGAWLVRYDS